jgi:hypothetical protein
LDGIIKYKGDETVNIDFPALNRNMDFKIKTEELIEFFGNDDSFKQEIEADYIRQPPPLWYIVDDYKGDGKGDLCCESIIRIHPFSLFRLYTYYNYEGGEIRPVQVCAYTCNIDDKTFYLKDFIFSVITFSGHLTIGENGIMEEEFQSLYDYTPDEMFEYG